MYIFTTVLWQEIRCTIRVFVSLLHLASADNASKVEWNDLQISSIGYSRAFAFIRDVSPLTLNLYSCRVGCSLQMINFGSLHKWRLDQPCFFIVCLITTKFYRLLYYFLNVHRSLTLSSCLLLQALLHSVPVGKMVVLDLFADVKPIWSRSDHFYGIPYIW